MRAKSFIKTSVNVTETRIDEGTLKKISCAKAQPCTWKNIAPKKKEKCLLNNGENCL